MSLQCPFVAWAASRETDAAGASSRGSSGDGRGRCGWWEIRGGGTITSTTFRVPRFRWHVVCLSLANSESPTMEAFLLQKFHLKLRQMEEHHKYPNRNSLEHCSMDRTLRYQLPAAAAAPVLSIVFSQPSCAWIFNPPGWRHLYIRHQGVSGL